MNVARTALTLGLTLVSGGVAIAQETARVSVDSSGAEGNRTSKVSAISADGRIVAFASDASDLVAGDRNSRSDVFVHDRSTGITERVSVDSSGAEADGDSVIWGAAISADGQIVVFFSSADDLVAGDTNWSWDVFVHDRSSGITERVSVDSSGGQGGYDSGNYGAAISADGSTVTFASTAPLVGNDTNGLWDVFVHDRSTGATERVSADSNGTEGNNLSLFAAISADGQIVAFESFASNLVANDTNGMDDIFVHDRGSGITERVSVRSSGAQANDQSEYPSISADGQFVAFASYASNLVAQDRNNQEDIFVRDRANATTSRVSVDSAGTEGDAQSEWPALSADARFVAYSSSADNLVSGDTNGVWDVFVRDRISAVTELASVDSAEVPGNGDSIVPAISANGEFVTFGSFASNLVANDTNNVADVFLRERCELATWTNYGAGFAGTLGVPSFTARANPVLGTTLTLDLANSYGSPTDGLLLIGFQRTNIPTNRGGDMLVVPSLVIPTSFSYSGNSYTGNIPSDDSLCGLIVDLQAIEADPGAAKGVSFTPGLELMLGL